MSYNGSLNFGLLADYDGVPDLDVIEDGIKDSLEELKRAARAQGAAAKTGNGGGAAEPTEAGNGRRTPTGA